MLLPLSIAVALWVFCVVDVVNTGESDVRHMARTTWLSTVLFVPLVGSVLWLSLGRPLGESGGRGSAVPAALPSEFVDGCAGPTGRSADAAEEFRRRCRARAEQQRRIGRERRGADGG